MVNQLTPQQKNEIKRIIRNAPDFRNRDAILGDFISKYLQCEAIARKLVYYNINSNSTNLNIAQIKAAFKEFISHQEDASETNSIINKIFKGGEGVRNTKSCRQLRNGYIHTMSDYDKTEIESRFTELNGYMDRWIELFSDSQPS